MAIPSKCEPGFEQLHRLRGKSEQIVQLPTKRPVPVRVTQKVLVKSGTHYARVSYFHATINRTPIPRMVRATNAAA